MRRISWCVVGTALAWTLVAPAPALSAVSGPLKFVGCYEGHAGTLGAGCTQASGLTGIAQMALDDQGHNLYATARTGDATGNALAIFDRNTTTGALTQKPGVKGCFSAPANTEGCSAIGTSLADNPLKNVVDVVVTHDGQNVYTVGKGGVLAAFSRDTSTGELTYLGCIKSIAAAITISGCTATANGLNDAISIAADPTDVTVYVANYATSRIGVFVRNKNVSTLGGLSQPTASDPSPWCFSQDGSDDSSGAGHCTASAIVSAPHEIRVTPDGEQVVVSSEGGIGPGPPPANVTLLNRNTGDGGSLSVPAGPFAQDQGRCVSRTGSGDAAGGCLTLARLMQPDQFALNADGSRVYVPARAAGAVLAIDRDTGTNAFALHSGTGACVFNGGPAGDCSYGEAEQQAYDVAIADGGHSLYVSALSNHAVTAYDVTADGGIVQKAPPFGCIFGGTFANCTKLITDSSVEGMVASADGRSVYAALNNGGNDDRILAFTVDRPPTCNPLAASTPFNTSVTIQLTCPDPDGDANTYSIVTQPATGNLGAVQSDGRVTYGPLVGTSGTDNFTFKATTPIVTAPGAPPAPLDSAPGTVSVNVAGPVTTTEQPPAPNPMPNGNPFVPPASRIAATVAATWKPGARFTTVRRLLVSKVPAGANVKLTCTGGKKRGCPFKSKALKVSGGSADARKPLAKARLKPKAGVEIAITKPGTIGKVVRYTIRSRKKPAVKNLCVPSGASKPQATC